MIMETKKSSVLEKLDNFVAISDTIGFISESVGSELAVETAFQALRQFETLTTSRFATYYCKNFNTKGGNLEKSKEKNLSAKHKVLFQDPKSSKGLEGIPFDGVPFIITGRKIYECQHGVDRHCLGSSSTSRIFKQESKKLDCPATVIIREVLRFPQYKISENTEKRRKKASEKLRERLEQGEVEGELRVVIQFPRDCDHANHFFGEVAGISQRIDSRIVDKINEMVEDGVRDVLEMNRHIQIFVRNTLFLGKTLPMKSNKRYFPSRSTIKNHMYLAITRQRLAKVDQENLKKKIETWKESQDDFFHFRPLTEPQTKEDTSEEDECDENDAEEIVVNEGSSFGGLLFVHQTKWQQHLLNRYGNELRLVDATYRTTKYSLPLYFLVVKTNVDYKVVASFVIQSETADAIREALGIIKGWNPSWCPKHFMVDYATEEISAVEILFSGCEVFICDFHREQAWERWLSKVANGMASVKVRALSKMRRLARASSVMEFPEELSHLKEDEELWSKPLFKNWFEKTWLRISKRWVWAYRKDRLLVTVNTNNGVERQNLAFKYDFLAKKRNTNLSGMITILIEEFLPESYSRYMENNVRLSGRHRRYSNQIPKYLNDRPGFFIDHFMNRLYSIQETQPSSVLSVDISNGVFLVKSQDQECNPAKPKWYNVSFGDASILPKCNCKDWEKHHLPCKHFIMVFLHIPDWGFDKIPKFYSESPFFTIDSSIVNNNTGSLPTSRPTLKSFNAKATEQKHNSQNQQQTSELPGMKQQNPTAISNGCKELLKELTSLVHIVDDASSLKKVHGLLKESVVTLQEVCKKEEGLFLERPAMNSLKRKKRKLLDNMNNKEKAQKKKYARIPLAKRKNPFSGRCGPKAEVMKTNLNCRFIVAGNPIQKKQKFEEIETEIAPLDFNTNSQSDEVPPSPEDLKNQSGNENAKSPGVQSLNNALIPIYRIESDQAAAKENHCVKGQYQDNSLASETKPKSITLQLTNTSTSTHPIVIDENDPDPKVWTTVTASNITINLYQEHKNNILNPKGLLSDSEITAALTLLKLQFKLIDGLHDTAIVGSLVNPAVTEFVQVVNTGGHWVCLSTVGCAPGVIQVFDSMFNTVQQAAKEHGCRMLHSSEKFITFQNMEVQKQSNGFDCGLFALAFATEISHGSSPVHCSYDSIKMRVHLVHCLENGQLSLFPHSQRMVPFIENPCTVAVPIYCVCRLPGMKKTTSRTQCSQCKEIYHHSCLPTVDDFFTKPWLCPNCKV